MTVHILYHDDPDGRCSAAIARKSLIDLVGKDPEDMILTSMNYGDPVPEFDPEAERVIILDFSIQPFEAMVNIADHYGPRLTWVDHHETSIRQAMDYGVFSRVPGERTIGELAACELTWREFAPLPLSLDPPRIVRAIGEWDSWRHAKMEHSDAEAIICAMDATPHDPGTKEGVKFWDRVLKRAFELDEIDQDLSEYKELLAKGEIVKSANAEKNRTLAQQLAFFCNFEGVNSVAMNAKGSSKTIESAYMDCNDLMVLFFWNGRHWTVSLYSDRENVHCGAMAKSVATKIGTNGGGHKCAAGFQASTDDLESLGLL